MVQLAVDDQTAAALEQWARLRATSTTRLAEEAIRNYLRAETQRVMQREAEAFTVLHAWLLEKYPGEFAAIYNGQLIDHDIDQVELFMRVEERHPGAPVLIRQIRPEPEATIHVRSPRIEHG